MNDPSGDFTKYEYTYKIDFQLGIKKEQLEVTASCKKKNPRE